MCVACALLVTSLYKSAVSAETDLATQTISTSTVWTKASSPYYLHGFITVSASALLSIEPGTEIDFDHNGYIQVYGSISVGSTSTDDTVRFVGANPDKGDGKGCQFYNEIDVYGPNGTPSQGVFFSHFEMTNGLELYMHGRIADISHGKFDCGIVGMRAENSQVNVSDSVFTDFSDTALQVVGSGVSISATTFDGGYGIGLSSLASNLVVSQSTAENFSVGMNIVATDATVTNSLFKQNVTGLQASDRVFLSSLIDLPPLSKNISNVYMYENIFDTNEYVATTTISSGRFIEQDDWAGDRKPLPSRRPVIVIPGILGSAFKDGGWVIDPLFHVYDNLLDTLRGVGFVDGVTLFPFGYDWHQSNEVTAILLKDFIQKVRGICGCDTVDIVAHSMGGLVARQYIQSADYRGDVGHMIFLGTPHLGSPSAWLTYMYDSFGDTSADKVLNFMFGHEAKANGYDSISSYIQGLPITSVKELLPITPYLYEPSGVVLPYTSTNYVVNNFLSQLRSGVQNLLNRTDVFNIFGQSDGSPTPSGFYMDGSPYFDDGGDGTVTWSDARAQLTTKSLIIDSGHADLPTNAQSLVVRTLTGVTPQSVVTNPFSPSYDVLIIKTLFPLHIFVIDPEGRCAGFYDNDASSTGVVDTPPCLAAAPMIPIDRAFYTEEASSTYIVIPQPEKGDYKIIVSSKEKDPQKAKTIKNAVVDVMVSSKKNYTYIRFTAAQIKALEKASEDIIIQANSDAESIVGGQTDPLPIDNSLLPPPDEFFASSTATSTTVVSVVTSDVVATSTGTTSTIIVSGAVPIEDIETISTSTPVTSASQSVQAPSDSQGQTLATAQYQNQNSPQGIDNYHHRSGSYHPQVVIDALKLKLSTLRQEWYNRAMEILEKLFGGAAKVRIIKLFLFNPEALYTRDEIISRTKSSMKDVKGSISLLEKVKFLKSKMVTTEKKKRLEAWYLDVTFPYIGALQSLLINIMPLSAGDITRRLQKAGKIKLILTSGVFIQNEDSRVDLLVVGDSIKRGSLENAVRSLEADIGKELTYAYFDTDDYLYRLGMYDKLVRDILDFPHTVVVDKITA